MPHQPRKKPKAFKKPLILVSFILVITGLTLILLSKSGIISPAEMFLKDTSGQLQSFFSAPFFQVKHLWSSYIDLQKVKEENQVLKAQLAELENEMTTYREALIENRRLKQLLEIKEKTPWNSIVAHVVGTDIAPWRAVLTIDVGKVDGLAEDMPVLCQGGLLGRIIDTSMHFSKVMLVTDYHSRIAAIVQRNRARGILKGDGARGCILDYVKKGVDIQSGDVIITSGLDGIFPKGLLVGKVKLVGPGEKSDLFQYIGVEPTAKINEAEEVLVLLKPLNTEK